MYIYYFIRFFFIPLPKIQDMTLEELERKLVTIRQDEEVTFKMLKERGLSRETIMHIHEGKDYNMSSLFKYLDALMYVIEVNGVIVSDLQGFSQILRGTRLAFNQTLQDIQRELAWNPKQVLSIEKGRGYTRSSLLKYTSIVKADYELISVFDLSSEIREALFKNT